MSYARNAMWIAMVAATFMAVQQAHAVANITASSRFIQAFDNTAPPVTTTSPDLDGVFNPADVVAPSTTEISASQDTNITPLLMAGDGFAGHFASLNGPGGSESFFEVMFDLAEPHNFILGGFLDVGGEFGIASASISLTGPGTNFNFSAGFNETENISEAGMLMAGSYTLTVQALTGPTDSMLGSAFFSAGLLLEEKSTTNTAVPEPISATLGLMGLGVLGMATRRRVA